MIKTYLTALLMLVVGAFSLRAQVTSDPTPLQEDSENVVIYFHADQGNKGLMGEPASAGIYAHTGVYINNGKTWKYAPSWGDNQEKYKLEYVSENLWKLNIGDIRTYYGVEDPAETVTKLCFVFRNANCSKEGKGTGNTDIFLDVVDNGFQMSLITGLSGNLVTPSTATTTIKVGTTVEADLTLSVNDEVIGEASSAKSLNVEYTFPGPGNYVVKATATADGQTLTEETTICYADDSKEAAYPGGIPQMGPVKNADGSVTFCLGAPEKKSVILVGEWTGYEVSNDNVMSYTDVDGLRYFWVTVSGLENDRMYGYYFLVDGETRVGDPYARLVLDPWNDKYLTTDVFPNLPAYPYDKITGVPLAVYQGNINDYDWKVENFKGADPSDLIIYELLFRDFTGTEGAKKGNGTVNQALEKLPYLKHLGVNAIEVLPIMEFNGNISWGYNPNFYFAPDKAYGTPADYKHFIDVCHQNGIAVILDMVFNQSDGLHPWYQMYQPGQNPFYNLDAPHAYSVLNDWNQGFPMVQQQFDDVLRYWMTEYKFDGFRFDLVKGLGDNDSYSNNGDSGTNAYNASRVARMREFQKVMEEVNPNCYFINENLAGTKEENEMAETGQLNWANVNNAGCQFAMGYSSDSNLNRMYAPKDGNRKWGSTVSYLESHDEQRLAYKQNEWGTTGVKGDLAVSMHRLGSAAAQMILAPGAHMIWQFSELGNDENTKNSNGGNNTDPKKVLWSYLDVPERAGLYENYAELIAIRNNNPVLFAESSEFTIRCAANDWANGRFLTSFDGDKELYTVINPSVANTLTATVNFASDVDSDYQILSKSYDTDPTFSASGKSVTLEPGCYVVIGSKAVAEVKGINAEGNSFRAYGHNGSISVRGLNGRATVYSADGKLMGNLADGGTLPVPSGLYIVKAGKRAVKVVVR